MKVTTVLLADDHAVVRSGLRNALANLPELKIVGEVGNGRELMTALEMHAPDLLVMDVAMPEFDPLTGVKQIKTRYPNLKILVVSAYADEAYVVGLLSAGVNGYHLKDQPLADLQLAAQRVLAGERWISGPLVERLVHRSAPAKQTFQPKLTPRQRELLRLLMQGYDNRKIAQQMDLSVKTVENQLTGLYRVLEVNSRLEAMNFAVRHPEVLAYTGDEDARPLLDPDAAVTLLLVDDNARYRQQLSRLIGKAYPRAVVYEAEDIAEALRVAQRVTMHLALVDVVLRDEDGIQCARRLKAASPTTRVILISAYPDREFRRLGASAGAVAFLDKKDLDAAAMRQVIQDALG
jgi:DNA-binding NarL/FixJ family response regulator